MKREIPHNASENVYRVKYPALIPNQIIQILNKKEKLYTL